MAIIKMKGKYKSDNSSLKKQNKLNIVISSNLFNLFSSDLYSWYLVHLFEDKVGSLCEVKNQVGHTNSNIAFRLLLY